MSKLRDLREVVILGVGIHDHGRFPNKSFDEMARDTIKLALKDAGASWKDVEALWAGHSYIEGTGIASTIGDRLGLTGIPCQNMEMGCSTGLGIAGTAYQAIAGGFYDVACVVGLEKRGKGILPADEFPLWAREAGVALYPLIYAWMAQRFMKEYGVTKEQLAKVCIKSHYNASLTPWAHYKQYNNLTYDDVFNSKLICDPMTVMQIAPVSEGAAAAIICAKEVAHRFPNARPINIDAYSIKSAVYSYPYSPTDWSPQVAAIGKVCAKEVYEQAGVGPKDLDVVACHDAYTIAEMDDYQVLGLCEEGECGRLVDEGATELTGRIPVNTDGGMMSRGNAIGACALVSLAENVLQLRGEAGPRQIAKHNAALTFSIGIGPVLCAMITTR